MTDEITEFVILLIVIPNLSVLENETSQKTSKNGITEVKNKKVMEKEGYQACSKGYM